MGVLSIVLLVLFVIVCLILVFLVAIQDENSEGIGGLFGGSSNSAFGSKIGSVVNKTTAILGISFMVLALLLAFLNKTPSQDKLLEQVKTEQVQQTSEWWNQTSSTTATDAPAATN